MLVWRQSRQLQANRVGNRESPLQSSRVFQRVLVKAKRPVGLGQGTRRDEQVAATYQCPPLARGRPKAVGLTSSRRDKRRAVRQILANFVARAIEDFHLQLAPLETQVGDLDAEGPAFRFGRNQRLPLDQVELGTSGWLQLRPDGVRRPGAIEAPEKIFPAQAACRIDHPRCCSLSTTTAFRQTFLLCLS